MIADDKEVINVSIEEIKERILKGESVHFVKDQPEEKGTVESTLITEALKNGVDKIDIKNAIITGDLDFHIEKNLVDREESGIEEGLTKHLNDKGVKKAFLVYTSISIENCQLEGNLDAGYDYNLKTIVVFKKPVSFISSTVVKKAGFEYAFFNDEANFFDASFNGEAYFRNSNFNVVSFLSATFNGKAYFRNATFNGETGFMSANFKSKTIFGTSTFFLSRPRTIFEKKVDFKDATFNGETYFTKINFKSEADFRDVTFNGEVDFKDTTFNGWAYFDDTNFNDEADFKNAIFNV